LEFFDFWVFSRFQVKKESPGNALLGCHAIHKSFDGIYNELLYITSRKTVICGHIHVYCIGIGTPLTRRPSHTTVHTGPYTAIRLIKAKSAVSNPTDLPGFQD